MKLTGAQRAWEILGWVVAGYSIYEKLKTLKAMEQDLFPYMTPEQQALFSKYVGAPTPVAQALNTTTNNAIPNQIVSSLTQVKSGT